MAAVGIGAQTVEPARGAVLAKLAHRGGVDAPFDRDAERAGRLDLHHDLFVFDEQRLIQDRHDRQRHEQQHHQKRR